MSHKLSKKNKTEMEYTELIREVIEYLLAAVLVILCVVVPLYARDGYHQIGNAKFEAYRRIMIGGFGVLLMLTAAYFMCRVTGRRLSRGGDAVQPHKVLPEGVSVQTFLCLPICCWQGLRSCPAGFMRMRSGARLDGIWAF